MSGHKKVYIWSSIDRIGNTIITFAGNIILARLLTPGDFGLVAMVGIFTAIAYNISGCGMSDGLIHKLNPTKQDYSTVFVFNAVMGLLFGIMFILMSNPIANFFEQPDLVGIMWAIGVCFFFQSLSFTQETRMRKMLEMKKMAIVRLSATICAIGFGIVLALLGYGYWGLVSSRIFLSFFLFIFYVIISQWIPKFAFYKDSFKEMFGYGAPLMMAYIFTQIGRNINAFVLGRHSPVASGIYSQAQKMEEVPFSITEAVFNWPFFSILANEADSNKKRILAQDMFSNIVLINGAIGLLLLLLSAPGFNFLFGEKWIEAIPIFRILILFGIFTAIKYYIQTILKVYGKTKEIRNISVVEICLQLGLLLCAYNYGIIMIALSQVVAISIVLVIYFVWYLKIEKITIMTLIMSIIRPMTIPLIAFVMVAVGYLYWESYVADIVNCLLIIGLYTIVFVCGCEIIKPTVYMKYRDKLISKFVRHN